MSGFPDGLRLLVSAVNGGGLLLVSAGRVEWLSRVDTAGIAEHQGALLLALQSGESNELRIVSADGQWDRWAVGAGRHDLHDVAVHDGDVHVVATESNSVLRLDVDGRRVVRHWQLPGEPDSSHVNALCSHRGRLLASRFGQFTRHRGYKGATAGAGEIFDVETGDVVVQGLSQPHSVQSHLGDLWVCDSEAYTLRRFSGGGAGAGARALGGYARGLAFADDIAYVGLSRGRNDPGSGLGHAWLVALDVVRMEELGRIPLPVDEVYSILPTTMETVALLRGGIADLAHGLRVVEHARNVAAAATAAQHALVVEREQALHAANLHGISLAHELSDERRSAGRASRLLDDARSAAGDEARWAAWNAAAAAEARDRLVVERGMALRDRAGLLARSDALAADIEAQRRYIEWIGGTRLMRWTGPFRRMWPQPPRVAVPEQAAAADPAAALPVLPDRALLPVSGLAFPEVTEPLVSIVVTAFGHFAETLACLRSIADAGSTASFEVILAEDASGEAEMARFATVPGLRYVSRPDNLGYLASVNAAVAEARGTYVHLLNNDTRVRPGWLDALLETFSLFEHCGIAGSVLEHPDGRLQEAGGIVWSDGGAMNEGRDGRARMPVYATVREVDYVSAASLLVPRLLWDRLGGFDARYAPAYYEDTDLAFRVREAGLRVYVQPGSVVEHAEGMSHGTDEGSGTKSAQSRNRVTFQARWGAGLERDQCLPGELHLLARERSQRRRMVLVVDRNAPTPDRDAGSRAIWDLLRVLSIRGFSVKFWSMGASEAPGAPAALRRHGVEFLCAAETGGDIAGWLRAHGALLDTVVISRPEVAREVVPAVRAGCDAKVVYYGHDIHHVRWQRQARIASDPGLKAHAAAMRTVERDIWRASDLVLYPSAVETGRVTRWARRTGSRCEARTVPLFVYQGAPPRVEADTAAIAARRDILFVGGFGHAPNADGVGWFLREAWPGLRAQLVDARLVLVGADPTEEIRQLAGERVLVTGPVDEAALVAFYAGARATIAPLRFGAGMKGKVVESMWWGVPCVTTGIGAEGLETAGEALGVGDTADALVAQLRQLFSDDAAWRARAQAGQDWVTRHQTVDALWAALSVAIDDSQYADVATRRAQIEARASGGTMDRASP